ncbi:hypothetical protein L1987_62640 [Smallanthus sonchifolius]|uniref:Uncharacterized protein n=1 Tax=Smallanthus sonchifolius TaxID=185202 RepID=A0ACB9CB19_9ASTR|nr:hypothetical protein L1987_62640 [Smallanthus sonchifolius]
MAELNQSALKSAPEFQVDPIIELNTTEELWLIQWPKDQLHLENHMMLLALQHRNQKPVFISSAADSKIRCGNLENSGVRHHHHHCTVLCFSAPPQRLISISLSPKILHRSLFLISATIS